MIDYDYTLQVDEGDEIKEFVPKIPTQIKNIAFITGPNSAGKSTLMNIIAAGLYGVDTDSVNKNLRIDIRDMLESDYKKVKFNINITSPDKTIGLRITKQDYNSQIQVEELVKGSYKSIDETHFKKKYNLIYDIPDNPRTRIKEISKIVRKDIDSYIEEVTQFNKNITAKVKEVKSVAREDDIKRLNIEIENGKKRLAELEESLPSDKQLVKDISRLLVAKQLLDAKVDEERKKKNLEEAQRLMPDVYELDRKAAEQYERDCAVVYKQISNFNSVKLGINSGLMDMCNEEEMSLVYKFRKLSIDDVLDTLAIPDGTLELINEVDALADKYSKSTSIEEQKKFEMLEKLISITEPYQSYGIDLPGYESLNEFITSLKKERDQYAKNNKTVKIAKSIKSQIIKLKQELFNVDSALRKVKKPGNKYDNEADIERQNKLARYQREYNEAKTNLKNAVNNASSYSVNQNNLTEVINEYITEKSEYSKLTTAELRIKQGKLNDKIADDETAKSRLESALPRKETELQQLMQLKSHPLKDKLPQLKKLEEQSMKLLKQLMAIQKKQAAVDNGSYGSYSKDDPYFEHLWKYLGKRMGTVNHIDAQYEVESVNTVDNIITTTTKKVIRINSMGTGQTQMTYLRSLLQKDDGRIVIALFDEVSTMTRQTLDVLFKEFTEMQKENRLLLGITVQPNDEDTLKVEEMGL